MLLLCPGLFKPFIVWVNPLLILLNPFNPLIPFSEVRISAGVRPVRPFNKPVLRPLLLSKVLRPLIFEELSPLERPVRPFVMPLVRPRLGPMGAVVFNDVSEDCCGMELRLLLSAGGGFPKFPRAPRLALMVALLVIPPIPRIVPPVPVFPFVVLFQPP